MAFIHVPVRNKDTNERSVIRIYDDEPISIGHSGFEILTDDASIAWAKKVLRKRNYRAPARRRFYGSVLLSGRS